MPNTRIVPCNPVDDVVFVEGRTSHPGVDMAILADCNHSIMSIGSFGWWSAWMAGGEVIYFEEECKNGTYRCNNLVSEDHFPPKWKTIADLP